MGRTKQTSRKAPKSGLKASSKAASSEKFAEVDGDLTNQYDSLAKDIVGDEATDSEDEDRFKKSGRGYDRDEEEDGEKPVSYMLFDFRKGKAEWPENVELVDQKRAEELLESATTAAEEAAKLKKKDGDDDDVGVKSSGTGSGNGSSSYWAEPETCGDSSSHGIHPDAAFETLNDGSQAFVLKPGFRLKLNLSDLEEGGDAMKEERRKKQEKKKKKMSSKSKAGAGFDAMEDQWDSFDMKGGDYKKWFKSYINEYTITMDIKLLEELPREGLSLFQTALIHSKENKKTGKSVLSRSDGECLVNQAGGVGMFGTYGDTTKARLEVGVWKRVVVSVRCVDGQNEKGEMRTWVNTEAGVVLKEESLVANERFAIDASSLYLFSSAQSAMMPGNIAIRTIRVDQEFCTDAMVKEYRARDKLSNIFMEDRKREVEEQRKGLALASLFAKPRPMWVAPAFIATFGDAFIERTSLEGTSNLAWSYTVLNLALQRMTQNVMVSDDYGIDYQARVGVSDTLHIFQQSTAVFKLMLKMLKTPSESQLLSFLRKIKKLIQALAVGESLLLPGLVEGQEILILLERTNERQFKVVVINTDATGGLEYHASTATEALPQIKYRTCLVMKEVSKKNVYDDVFWLAFFNMAINQHHGDVVKFYDVLIPFLSGKPLEATLVEAESVGLEFDCVNRGSFRFPQKSRTAYVQCILEALYYLLRSHNVAALQADLVHLCLCTELVAMMKNDLTCMLPDESGVRVCRLALRELSHFAVALVNRIEANGAEESKSSDVQEVSEINCGLILANTQTLVQSVEDMLSYCKFDEIDLPPALDLAGPATSDTNEPALTQYRDALAWDVPAAEPDPGQDVSLRKYLPVDLLQIPQRARTRDEAITAIRQADKLCTLIGNQNHCIKNDKFLICSVIEHVFIQIVPIPKPRGLELSNADLYRSGRSARRAAVKEAKEKLKAEEKEKRLEEKRVREESENEAKRRRRLDFGLDGDGDDSAPAVSSKASKRLGTSSSISSTLPPPPVKCFGEEVLPDYEEGKIFENGVNQSACIWDQPISYELQVELLITLQRLTEQFAAAALSIQQSRPFDAVCIVVPGCIAALADSIIRKLAIDEPSELCSHLMGRTIAGVQLGHPGFGISVGSFATQSETLEIHCAELAIARTAVLDYFQSPSQVRLQKIFAWEEEFVLKPGKNLIKFLRMVSRDIALPNNRPNMLIVDSLPTSSLLIKNYPELVCYRDIAFWWKYFMNTDNKVFPNYVPLDAPREVARMDRMSAQLRWTWDDNTGGYEIQACGLSLKCRPDPNQINPLTGKVFLPEQLPTHRFPSTATPSFFVPPPIIKTEDDVIYRPNLPNFEDKFGQVLNQRDSELLISYLTVPYMRLPLILSFFASEDRIHKLQSKQLRLILDSVLFEPGKYLRMDMVGVAPVMVPTSHPDLLATSYGLLLNELCRSPDTVLRSVLVLMKGALACDTGSVVDEGASEFNTSTKIILYITRLGSRVDNYLSFMIDWATNSHDCIDCPLRELDISVEVLSKLTRGRAELRDILDRQFQLLFEDYLRRLDAEVSSDPNNEKLIDRNSALACDLHSHKLLLYRNYKDADIQPHIAKTLVGSFVYLTTRHTWNKSTTEGARLNMPETELYELLQVSRRRLIRWLSSCKQGNLDEVMQTALQVSSSLTGSLMASAEILDIQNRWSRIKGDRSCGRWAVGSSRTVAVEAESNTSDDEMPSAPKGPQKMLRQVSYEKPVGEVDDTGMLGVEIDLQMGQMTLRSKHLAALITEIANHPDVVSVFGDATMQASLIERAEHRQIYRLVGLNHELEYWPTGHTMCPPLGDEWEREYDPKDLFDSERWIATLFEPIRQNFFNGPQPPPMQFMMPDKPISREAEVAVLLGLHQSIGGPWKLVYLFRRLRCVHVYECVSQGREWWYSLHLTTDHRYTLREMQPSHRDRKVQYPDWWIRGSGAPYPMGVSGALTNDIDGISQSPQSSVIVIREQQHHLNLSGGKETLVPSRLLYGTVPSALLEAYTFWQDESIAPRGTPADEFALATRGHKRLLGYPKQADGEYMIIVEFRYTGSWTDFVSPPTGSNCPKVLQCTNLPGRTVRITRKLKIDVENDFRRRQRIAQQLESSKLLVNPPKRKKRMDDESDKSEMAFKVDAQVECDYEGKGVYWPCVVCRVNDNGTYDIEYVNDYKWVGVQRGVDSDLVQKRGDSERKKQGEGVWHWDGMSDSEDDDWRYNSDDDILDKGGEDTGTNARIGFYHFDELNLLLSAAGGDEDTCLAAISRLASVPGVLPFTDIHKLARAISDLIRRDSLGDSLRTGNFSASTSFGEEFTLLNLLYAPRRSRLFSVLKTLSRIENAAHICAWTKSKPKGEDRFGPTLEFGCPSIDLIEIPRLKLAFCAREDHTGQLKLYSVDHVDLFITNEFNAFTSKLLAGIQHSLLLSNVRGEMQVLVPVIPPKRPRIASEPFSTFIVLDRTNIPLAERFFLYPVHISLSFLLTKGLNSAVYLMLLRFLHRDYADVFRLADSIATDTKFNPEGQAIFKGFENANDDWHPDAHACRLKISLVTIDSGSESPWDLTIECSKHTVKLDNISSSCRLSPYEELQLLESDNVVTSSSCAKFDREKHSEYAMALCYNRQHLLRSVLKQDSSSLLKIDCRAPPRAVSSNWPYYQDNTVFGENYSQMIEISNAEEGENSWSSAVQGQGGDETDVPPGGWLVVACFHTLWSTASIKLMPSISELVPIYQDMVNFLSVRADCQGMIAVSRKLEISVFPTIALFRGGRLLEKLEGSDRLVEKLMRLLGQHVKPADAMAHSKHKHRIKLEKALLLGIDPTPDEPEERGQLDWTWDPDNCGESMQVEKDGMQAIIGNPDDNEDGGTWEYSYNNRTNWVAFPKDVNKAIEAKYSCGEMYTNYFENDKFEIYTNNIEITSWVITGWYGTELTSYRTIYVRRQGDRKPVPGEEPYVSKEQKEKDKRSAEWREKLAAYRLKIKQEKVGKDVEGMRGSIGMLPNTGKHTWTLRWNHEPARFGTADAVGICSDSCEYFGPGPAPCIGGDADSGSSIALYANGDLFHNGTLMYKFQGSRNIPPEASPSEPPSDCTRTDTAEPASTVGSTNESSSEVASAPSGQATEAKRKRSKVKSSKQKVEVVVPYEARAPMFGKKSTVRVEFDSDLEGGTLVFIVDGKHLEGYEITGLYKKLGGSEIFPCVCLCPFDLEDPAVKSRLAEEAALTEEEVEEEEDEDETGADEEKDDEQPEGNGEGTVGSVKKVEATTEEDEFSEFPSVTLLPHDDESVTGSKVDCVSPETSLVPDVVVPSITESITQHVAVGIPALNEDASSETKEAKDSLPTDEEKVETIPNSNPIAEDSPPVPKGTEPDKAETVPIEKIRWMYETEAGWVVYSLSASRELEEAQRDGKSEYSLTLGESTHKCNLDQKKQYRSDSDNEFRMRRHVISDGDSALWEILTMKYERPHGMLTGSSVIKLLEKIWTSEESMSGHEAGCGFLFLYALLSGDMRCRICNGGGYEGGSYGSYGPANYGAYSSGGTYSYGGKTVSTGSNDAHRFALLVTQLYSDKHAKSLPASIVNVLGRNKQVSLRMPKFKDTRKANQTPFFNGWIDEYEPRSPVAELMSKVVPLMRLMKRKGAFHFPPPPPHPELPSAATSLTVTTTSECARGVHWDRPELTDFSCQERILKSIDSSKVLVLSDAIHYRFADGEITTSPPLFIEDTSHFTKVFQDSDRLVVVDFFASWCGPCTTLAPVFRLLSLQTPTAVFLKVDVDVCDELAAKFQIKSMPHTVFMRGGPNPSNILASISGGGPDFIPEFLRIMSENLTEDELVLLKKYHSISVQPSTQKIIDNIATSDTEVDVLASKPLAPCLEFVQESLRSQLGMPSLSEELPFDVTSHDAAKTAPAISVLNRFKDDICAFSQFVNTSGVVRLLNLADSDIIRYFEGDLSAVENLHGALHTVKALNDKLISLKEIDALMIQETIPLVEKAANWVPRSAADSELLSLSKTKFILSRHAGQNASIWAEFLFGALLSSCGEEDLLKLNPFLPHESMRIIMDLVAISMLRANRLGHTNRCIGNAISLESMLTKVLSMSIEERLKCGPSMIPKLIQIGEELAKNLTLSRHYMEKDQSLTPGFYKYDPRYLVFEFVWNIQLRQKQVEIVNDFRNCLAKGRSKVKQMIMGAGKTSVVAPLLALIVADGKSLVLSVVPKALVEMSRTRMRETFSVIMVKRIYTLEFDRSTIVRPSMRRSLENAAANRGVVVATPTTLKSIMLTYVEALQNLREAHAVGIRSKVNEYKLQAEELGKILTLFKEGVMLLDEVDLILHPLKSELNFPIGDKFDLDCSDDGERWGLPIHLLDALFFCSTGKVSSFDQKGTALEILKKFATVIQQGIAERNLQRLPHVTLLNLDYYHSSIKPIMAEWAYLWLQKQHIHGIDRAEAVQYMLEGAASRSDNITKLKLIEIALTKARAEAGIVPFEPSPTRGFERAMSSEVREQMVGTVRKLQRERSISVSTDSELNALLTSQIQQLELAQKVAEHHRNLVNEIYAIDEVDDNRNSSTALKLADLQAKMALISKKISDIECPRDDSLDNCVIVWCSNAFAPVAGGVNGMGATAATSASPGESSVPTVCAMLEDMGLTVKRCADADEAISRARDLQLESQLRCLIVGGDERAASCDSSCTKAHTNGGNCIRCGNNWNRHSGHNCPNGGRGSWLLPGNSASSTVKCYNPQEMFKTLTDVESAFARAHGAVPAKRTAVYTAHSAMPEADRMSFWKLGSTVTDDPKQLVEWVSSLATATSDSPDTNADDGDDPIVEVSAPIKIKRENSLIADKRRIAELKESLEQLEIQKAGLLDEEENVRKVSQGSAAEKTAELITSVHHRIEILTSAKTSIDSYLAQWSSYITTECPAIWMGPQSGRAAALALAWFDVNLATLAEARATGTVPPAEKLYDLQLHSIQIANELSFLRQMTLAAKVVAHVTSPSHKKLLNLCYNWLSTFLPHCLSKVNRVSFGLLSVEDCRQALELDPHVPRSRLKLAVPFIGKDVPSKSSEFAHPDIIIGLTVLAYRYSGLRKDDFIEIVDAMTSQFSQEIGPARDRESSLRHEQWVFAAGGAVRGLKTTKEGKPWAINIQSAAEEDAKKEVVQLKFLQKSNEEQMEKLFQLLALEPLTIHYYLQRSIFPIYMRSQHLKLSASGQAVGGDMLVGRRVGFSGTPSDLLPEELGRCDYETGDDGMMISTVLDRKVASFEYLKDQWTVEYILEHIATSESPRYHALIDTGALITGYSNREVAQQLLDRGLSWCEGVIFLDEDDKQQVLVRATGRIVSADQCGVSLDKRFAFYDQIHTTGMDIKHVVNATAVITLGKDMVFRDYVQGAYRMRGIGIGQKIHIFVIPEVQELMQRELKTAIVKGPLGTESSDHVLENIVAWLVINSLRSEQTQWTMLCLQNISNLYRKNAFQCLHEYIGHYLNVDDSSCVDQTLVPSPASEVKTVSTIADIAASLSSNSVSTKESLIEGMDKNQALSLFKESIDFSLYAGVPDPVPFADKLRGMLDEHEAFLLPEQHAIGHSILVVVGQFASVEGSANRLDTEQEREQEQEQEKEVEARRDQQIEVEKFVDREYSRQEEVQRPWPFTLLAKPIPTDISDDHPFYPLKEFRLRHQESLGFDTSLFLSSNYFNPNWTGLRRVKNVVMVMEFSPSTNETELRLKMPDEVSCTLSQEQELALRKAHSLLSFYGNLEGKTGLMNRSDLRNAIAAVTDVEAPSEDLIDMLLSRFTSNHSDISLDELRRILTSGVLFPAHHGRYWVALSLAEAETIRRILHLRKAKDSNSIIPNATTELSLRYSPLVASGSPASGDGGVVFDSSWGWQKRGSGATAFEAAVCHNSFRFFDCDIHFSEPSQNILVRSLRASTKDRERFFMSTIGCRRRMERKWQDTPLVKIFTVADEWVALKHRAQALFVIESLKYRKLTLWEAFTAFDFDNNGILSPSEFYGALKWLGVPDLTADDVVDFIEVVDKNRDGMIDYREYTEMLKGLEDSEHSNGGEPEEENHTERIPLGKIEPFGAEELRDIMVRRRQAELARQREERLRRQAYKDTLDIKVFEEELEASKLRKGGANPILSQISVITESSDDESVSTEPMSQVTSVADYKFFSNQLPLRCSIAGKGLFFPIFTGTAADRPVKPMTCKKQHTLSAYSYYWQNCGSCKKQHTQWACWNCNYFVCSTCFDGDKKAKELERRDPARHPTFFRCNNGCNLTIQIPSQGGANPLTGEFTITLESRFEKLPPAGKYQSVLRFSTADAVHSRRLHKTSVFLTASGVIAGRPEFEPQGNPGRVVAGKWCIISIVVQPSKGIMTTYVNGALCHEDRELESSDLQLQHKIVVYGGGKQAHSRGGDIRRIHIHGCALGAKATLQEFFVMSTDSPSLGCRIARVQACYRAYHYRRQQKEIEAQLQASEKEEEKEKEATEGAENSTKASGEDVESDILKVFPEDTTGAVIVEEAIESRDPEKSPAEASN